MTVATTQPVGDFPGKPAPDETWMLRGDPWPECGVIVDVCYARRDRHTKELLSYLYGRAVCNYHRDDGMSEWSLENGSTVWLNPDFWRPVA